MQLMHLTALIFTLYTALLCAQSEVTCRERCFYIYLYLLWGLKQHNPHMYDICYNPQMCENTFEIYSQYQKLSWLVSSDKKKQKNGCGFFQCCQQI